MTKVKIRISAEAIASKFAGKTVRVVTKYLDNGSCESYTGTISSDIVIDENGNSQLLVWSDKDLKGRPYTVEYLINSGNDFSKVV